MAQPEGSDPLGELLAQPRRLRTARLELRELGVRLGGRPR